MAGMILLSGCAPLFGLVALIATAALALLR